VELSINCLPLITIPSPPSHTQDNQSFVDVLFFQKALFEEQRQRSRLEQSVANAAQDAQTQINEQTTVMGKLDQILVDVQRNFATSKKEAVAHIVSYHKIQDSIYFTPIAIHFLHKHI